MNSNSSWDIEGSLVGKKIKAGRKINDDHYLFDLEEGPVSLYVEGDCCSTSWIESVEGEDALTNATIVEVNQATGEEGWIGGEPEELGSYLRQTYFLKIRTDKGYWDMEFRNDSNGYYGAILSLMKGDMQ